MLGGFKRRVSLARRPVAWLSAWAGVELAETRLGLDGFGVVGCGGGAGGVDRHDRHVRHGLIERMTQMTFGGRLIVFRARERGIQSVLGHGPPCFAGRDAFGLARSSDSCPAGVVAHFTYDGCGHPAGQPSSHGPPPSDGRVVALFGVR